MRARLRKWMPFSKCDTCIEHRRAINCCSDEKEKVRLRKNYRAHLKHVLCERRTYYNRRRMARTRPTQYLSLIIDGADQAKYAIPYTHEKSHLSDSCWKLKTHLMGVIVHNGGHYAYTITDNVKMGNNATIDVLQRTLLKHLEKNGYIPRKLYLQLDNTTHSVRAGISWHTLPTWSTTGCSTRSSFRFCPSDTHTRI